MWDMLLASGIALVFLVGGILLAWFAPAEGPFGWTRTKTRTAGIVLIICALGLVVGQAMVTFG